MDEQFFVNLELACLALVWAAAAWFVMAGLAQIIAAFRCKHNPEDVITWRKG